MLNRTRIFTQTQTRSRFFSQALNRFDKISKNLFTNLSKEAREHILNPEKTPSPSALSSNDKGHLLDYIRINLLSNLRLNAFRNFENCHKQKALDVSSYEGANLANLNFAISILTNSFPQIFIVDYIPASPLHLIAYSKSYDNTSLNQIKPLCSSALLDHRDFSGNTALHVAALERNHSLIKWLIAQGADAELKNNKGLSAAQCFNNAIVDLINPNRSEYMDGTFWNWADKNRPSKPSEQDVEIFKLFDGQAPHIPAPNDNTETERSANYSIRV